jgi:uncharacterized membrane protein
MSKSRARLYYKGHGIEFELDIFAVILMGTLVACVVLAYNLGHYASIKYEEDLKSLNCMDIDPAFYYAMSSSLFSNMSPNETIARYQVPSNFNWSRLNRSNPYLPNLP